MIARRAPVALALLVVGLVAGGCSDAGRWARWQAERDAWRAERASSRVRLEPALATAAQWEAAESSYRRVAERWPASRWASRAREGGAAAEVARIAGRSGVAAGRFAELRGRPDAALAIYAAAGRDWRVVDDVALEADVSQARLLAALGRPVDALAIWERVAAIDPVGPDGAVRADVLDAPLIAASMLAEHGEESAADSMLAAAVARYASTLASPHPPGVRAVVWERMGEARASMGDGAGALSALRRALAVSQGPGEAARTVLLIAQRALDLQMPDTALTYAIWARDAFGGVARAGALQLAARAWEQRGAADSALVAWGALLEVAGDDPALAAESRARRGELLERLGQWEQARSEYRSLAASEPTHPLALEALVRIVQHHLAAGQEALARIEGARALETLDHIIATQHDPDVSFGARRTRALILERLGDAAAERALTEVWRSDPTRHGAAEAGLAAAHRALARSGGRADAEALLRDLVVRSPVAVVRRVAAADLERLGVANGRGKR